MGTDYVLQGAQFNSAGDRRFLLWRDWRHMALPGFKRVSFVMLNPSTADNFTDDATVRKCVGFAKRWGFDGVMIANLIPIITTDPWELPHWAGYFLENERYLKSALENETVVAWGHVDRRLGSKIALSEHINSFHALTLGEQLYCLGRTALLGSPRHPSRAPYGDRQPWDWGV